MHKGHNAVRLQTSAEHFQPFTHGGTGRGMMKQPVLVLNASYEPINV